MLYIFHVDIGMMLTFDMSLAMQSVVQLQDAIMNRCHIPRDKQVLLISGGDNLDPSARVCSYSAGTDSNPIFLFSKMSIESATPPSMTGNYITDAGLLGQLDASLHLPPTYETIACRAQIAVQLRDVARELYVSCQCLVHDQHLQHQGWAAVTANLDDITSAFRSRSAVFLKSFDEYLSTRGESMEILAAFSDVMELLNTIPLLSCSSSLSVTDAKTLLDWINAQDKRNTLEQMVQQCQTGLDQYDSKLRELLSSEMNSMLTALDNANMIEVRGVEERLSRLEHMMIKAKDSFDDIVNSTQGLVQNQTRARTLQDTTVYPDLCMKHRELLTNMSAKFQLLQDIQRRIIAAKDELSANLHTRLRWVMLVEKSICDLDSRLVIRHETLKKIKHRIEILRQIHSAPTVYCRALVEVVRRKQFSSQFLQWADSTYEKYCHIQSREKELRDQFETCIGKHFLKALFPGFDDMPPSFMSKVTTELDNRLPSITGTDIEFVQQCVPQLTNELRISVEDFTVVSVNDDSVPIPCDVSSQSVEIISHEESQLLKLESLVVPPGDDVITRSNKLTGSPDNAFVTADFYIDESLPSSPATDSSSRRKLVEVNASLQEAMTQNDLLSHQLSEVQTLNLKLENELSLSAALNQKLRHFVNELQQSVSFDTVLPTDVLSDSLVPIVDIDIDLFNKSLTEFVTNIKCSLDRQDELKSQLEQKHLEYTIINSEFEQFRQTATEQLQQINSDHVNKCRQIENMVAKDKIIVENKLQMFEELLLAKENDLINLQSKKELLTKEFEEQLALQKAQIEKEADEKLLVQVKGLENQLKCLDEEHCKTIEELKLCCQTTVEDARKLQESAEQDRNQAEKHKDELIVKLDAVEQQMKCAYEIVDKLEQEKRTHDETLKQVKEDYDEIIDELNKKLSARQRDVDNEMNLQLVLDDYLPMQRHEEVVTKLNDQLKSADEEKAIEFMHLTALHDFKVSELVNKHENEIHHLKSQYEQEILALKCELMKQDLNSSQMTESVMPASVTMSMHSKAISYSMETKPKEVMEKEQSKLDEKLAVLSLSPQDYDLVRKHIVIGACREGDVVLFTWDETHKHFLACLPDDCHKHFLHSDCLESLGLSPDGYAISETASGGEICKKSIILQITSKEYCLAKKANNRFRVPLNTKFFRVKAKPVNLVTS